MSTFSVREIVRRKRKEYLKAGKATKKRMLDEVEELTGYHRKSLVRLFRERVAPRKTPIRRPRARKYTPILPQLRVLWATSFYACGKRLRPFLVELLCALKRFGEIRVTREEELLLASISAATIDRMLAADRAAVRVKGRSTTKPGTLLKHKIPIRTFAEWDDAKPGFLEVDLVAHCGETTAGEYVNTLNMTDVETGWTICAAFMGRSERFCIQAIEEAKLRLPFTILGIDSDNDAVFINAHLKRYCERGKITFTRSRPYKKNDQCHVEQKNWSVVRQFIGYRRFETDEELALLQKVYPLIMAYHNFFSPMMRLVEKKRDGSKVTKRYSTARTPYQSLMTSNGHIDEETKEQLRREYESTNPAELLRQIRAILRRLEQTGDHPAVTRHTRSLSLTCTG